MLDHSGRKIPWWAVVLVSAAACNDITEPLPSIEGIYSYNSTGGLNPARQRQGSITIIDRDRLTAGFVGTFAYTSIDGNSTSGDLIGAFMTRDRIWFRFLTEPFEYHEATFLANAAAGEIFIQGRTYFRTGSTFTLRP